MFGFDLGLSPQWMQAMGGIDEGGALGGVGGGFNGGDPRVQAYNASLAGHNSAADPRGLNNPRGGLGAPSMPMGDMPPRPQVGGSFFGVGGPSAAPVGDQDGAMPSASMPSASGNSGMFGRPKPHFKGLFPGKDWKTWVGKVLPAALAGYSASMGNPAGMAMLQGMQRMRENEQEARLKAMMPQQVGGSLIRMNAQGGYDTLFRDPEVFENYAASLGLQPGTPEYQNAVKNYRLGAWSDPAVEAKMGLTGFRFDRQGALQEDRQDYGREMQEDRQTHSDAQLGRRLDVTRRGQDLTNSRAGRARPSSTTPKAPGSENALYADIMRRWSAGGQMNGREKEFVRAYELRHQGGSKGRGGGKPSGGADLIGPVQTNHSTGQRIQYSKSKGAYVDLATGQVIK